MTTKPEIEDVALNSINVDGFTQTREFMDHDVVKDYQDAYQSGTKLPPVVLFEDGKTLWVGDGFHRIEAAMGLGLEKISAEIHTGGRVDALRYALGANANHGLRRTTGDLNQAVVMAWESREELGLGKNPSARLIAELVKVSPTTAMKHLRNATGYDPDAVRTGADGKEYPAASRRSEEPRVQPSESRNGPAVVEMDLEKDAEESMRHEMHGFKWNDCGCCENPRRKGVAFPKDIRAEAFCEVAIVPSGMFVFGYQINLQAGDFGGVGVPVSLTNTKFRTELEAVEAFLDVAQAWFVKQGTALSVKVAKMLLGAEATKDRWGDVEIVLETPAATPKRKKVDIYTVVAKVKCTLRVCAVSEAAAKAAIEAEGYKVLLENGAMSDVDIWEWEKASGFADEHGVLDLREWGSKEWGAR
jgi:hypothetical protein